MNNNSGEILPHYMFYIEDIGRYINIQEHFLLFLQKTVGSGVSHSHSFKFLSLKIDIYLLLWYLGLDFTMDLLHMDIHPRVNEFMHLSLSKVSQ